MSFQSGRVTFCRFRVQGSPRNGTPAVVDEALLTQVADNAFTETAIGAPDEVEVGWITGEHLLDIQFTYEKNGYGDMLLLAMRLDTHKVPADIKHAYKRLNEQALASGNPSGFASKGQKREAAETAARQIHEDLANGKFRKSKIVPVLWDLKQQVVYCSAVGDAVSEQISKLFRQSFKMDLEIITAGGLAGSILRSSGRGRDYEDLKPAAFTAAPAAAGDRDDVDEDGYAAERDPSIPAVPWVQSATDMKDFLGNELLLWLWWVLETREGAVQVATDTGSQEIALVLDKALDMDCAWGVLGKQTLRGDGPTRFAEAGEALRHGKWPRKAGLILSDGEHQWELTLQGDRFIVSSAALPEVPEAESPRQITEYRLLLVRRLCQVLDGLMAAFLKERISSAWAGHRQALRQWIQDRRKKPLAIAG